MRVELSQQASKYLKRLNSPLKERIIEAMKGLSEEPPRGDIRALSGRDGYRIRVGDYRILFDIDDQNIIVHDIAPRGQAYKGRR